ncbi:unnamed protein product [[Candida] boidinii]|nr:unnamed protein product [[Candida] boidinii]
MLLELKNEINYINSKNNLSDTQIKSYLQLFNESKLDPFSSWDLENENVMYNTKYLDIDDDELRRLVFDSWCKIKTAESGDLAGGITQTEDHTSSSESVNITNSKSFNQDQDEISNEVYEFIKFLDEYSKNSKLLKYFIEFKRKLKKDKNFQDLELYKSLNFNKMEFFYKNYIKFIKLQNENENEKENEIENFIINSLESNKNLKKLNFNNLHNINYNNLIELINTNKINSIKSLIYKIIDDDNIDNILYELYREVTLVTFNSDNEINQKLKLISILKYFTNQKKFKNWEISNI